MIGNGYQSGFVRVPELPMATLLAHLLPAVGYQQSDDVSRAHLPLHYRTYKGVLSSWE